MEKSFYYVFTMKIFDEILQTLTDFSIKDVRVGKNWTVIESRNCGFGLNFPETYHMFTRFTGELIGKSAKEIAQFSKSWNPTEASIGVAAINSLIDPVGEKINGLDYIEEIAQGKKIVFIGHFPRLGKIKNRAKSLEIIEKAPKEGDYPDTASEILIPRADIVVISGSVFVNKTYKRLLELSKNCYTILLGPSVIMSDVLFEYGVDALAGSTVLNPTKVLITVSQGAHLKDFSKYLQYIIRFREKR